MTTPRSKAKAAPIETTPADDYVDLPASLAHDLYRAVGNDDPAFKDALIQALGAELQRLNRKLTVCIRIDPSLLPDGRQEIHLPSGLIVVEGTA